MASAMSRASKLPVTSAFGQFSHNIPPCYLVFSAQTLPYIASVELTEWPSDGWVILLFLSNIVEYKNDTG